MVLIFIVNIFKEKIDKYLHLCNREGIFLKMYYFNLQNIDFKILILNSFKLVIIYRTILFKISNNYVNFITSNTYNTSVVSFKH